MSETTDRQILMTMFSGGDPTMQLGTIKDVAGLMKDADYGHADVSDLKLFALNGDVELIEMRPTVRALPFNEDEWSDRMVTVTFPDGVTATAGYRIDGRV